MNYTYLIQEKFGENKKLISKLKKCVIRNVGIEKLQNKYKL